ncbi:HD domain-containing protein [Candidatus Pantoea deserta]|uniref:HD domain-containing protein n=1 Tax=Candidatus Pantoea deserta TaxID=1869313 RepID=A0A3N4NMZ5_9GAMM|nr:HD domain-containing protein [Pantoea deserta]RPD93460.1 HD domain-containing protein [Pantoea deserta]
MKLSERAKLFATLHHENAGQKRKFTGEPYIVHPAAVVALLESINPTEEMRAAAWLHDIVEDTDVTLREIELRFGSLVGQYVEMLTDVRTRRTGGERIDRKNGNLLHSAQASAEAKSIKLCDLIDNACSVVELDPAFACNYLLEMKRLLTVLNAGHPLLYARAQAVCEDGLALLHRQQGSDEWFKTLWEYYEQHTPLSSVARLSGTEQPGSLRKPVPSELK